MLLELFMLLELLSMLKPNFNVLNVLPEQINGGKTLLELTEFTISVLPYVSIMETSTRPGLLSM